LSSVYLAVCRHLKIAQIRKPAKITIITHKIIIHTTLVLSGVGVGVGVGVIEINGFVPVAKI